MLQVKGDFIRVLAVLVFAVPFCMFPASAFSRVIVDDTVVVKGNKVMLRAETKGRLFSKGGELVEFFVDGKSIGKNLSGGDGVAFKQFVPAQTGLHQISVKSGGADDAGLLLSLERGSSIVFIDVEGSLLEGLFSQQPKPGSHEAVKEIHKRFSVVYLQTSLVGVTAIKGWLQENEFVELPVIPWKQGAIFDEITEKDLRINAIIAGKKVIESASAQGHKPLAFSFETVKDAQKVKDWEEIIEKLK